MARIKLTAGKIQDFTCPADKAQAFLWDSDVTGLALRCTPTGAKAYIFQSRFNDKAIRITIGDIKAWAIGEARARARELQATIDQGRDPRVIKKEKTEADAAKREKAKQEETPALEAWGEYIKVRAPKWSERHKADHETMSREGGEVITRGRRQGMAEKKEQGILRPLLELPLTGWPHGWKWKPPNAQPAHGWLYPCWLPSLTGVAIGQNTGNRLILMLAYA